MNAELKTAKNNFSFNKDFLKLMHRVVGSLKTMEKKGKQRDIKLIKTEERRNYLVLEPNYYTVVFFF